MKLTKCVNGHYYDAERYSSCPHCAGGKGMDPKAEDNITEAFVMSPGKNLDFRNNYDWYSEGITVGEPRNGEETLPISPKPLGSELASDGNSRQDDDNKTMSWFNDEIIEQNKQKILSKEGALPIGEQRKENARPVVGWLVCIEGSNYGESFCLYVGKNFIGRNKDNDICLSGDRSISRSRHAVVIYEPIQRQFFVQPGDVSHELCYLNGNVVLSNPPLHDRDKLTLGKSSLVFVPFCDEQNNWGISKTASRIV